METVVVPIGRLELVVFQAGVPFRQGGTVTASWGAFGSADVTVMILDSAVNTVAQMRAR